MLLVYIRMPYFSCSMPDFSSNLPRSCCAHDQRARIKGEGSLGVCVLLFDLDGMASVPHSTMPNFTRLWVDHIIGRSGTSAGEP